MQERSAEAASSQPRQDVLKNRLNFPSFWELPHENGVDLEYYPETLGVFRRCRTWYFLAEITFDEHAPFPILRRRILVKDREDHDDIPIAFYPEFGTFDYETLKKGWTVAVVRWATSLPRPDGGTPNWGFELDSRHQVRTERNVRHFHPLRKQWRQLLGMWQNACRWCSRAEEVWCMQGGHVLQQGMPGEGLEEQAQKMVQSVARLCETSISEIQQTRASCVLGRTARLSQRM